MAKKSKKPVAVETTDAIEFLESQHREVEDLFKKIESGKNASSRDELFQEIAKKLETHCQIEEKIMYPAGKPVDPDETLEAYEEHGMVREMIAKIFHTEVSDESFMAKITVLKEMIEHHVKEEEETYFPEMRKSLGDERITELGEELRLMFDEIEDDVAAELPAAMAAKKKTTKSKVAPRADA